MLSDEECREIWRTALARCHPTNDISVAGVFAARAAYALGVEQTTAALSKPASEDAREGFVSVPVEALEAIRKNDERYRWLRSRIPGSAYRIAGVIYSEGGAGVDSAIDAAMIEAAKGGGK